MRYIQILSNSGDVQTALDAQELGKPYVVFLENEHRIDWNSQEIPEPVYSAQPLTFEIISAGTIVWKRESMSFMGSAPERTIEYSINEGAWTEITSTTAGAAINVATGDIISFRGNNTVYSNQDASYLFGNMFQGTAVFKAYGNINSLIDAVNFSAVSFWEKMVFAHLFKQSVGLIDAENLIMQVDNSNGGTCSEMFYDCTNLTTAPKVLLAPSASGCYKGMFRGCTSLTTAPELPSTTLASDCYTEMFLNCTSLTTAPELPATRILERSYQNMFNGCSSLSYIKCLATTMWSNNSTGGWVAGVSPTGTFVKNPSMSSWTTGTGGIPDGWTVEDAVI